MTPASTPMDRLPVATVRMTVASITAVSLRGMRLRWEGAMLFQSKVL
jgi:hypothetical protein